jgi:hypothetical protein
VDNSVSRFKGRCLLGRQDQGRIGYNRRDLTNSKNAAAKKMGDNDSPMTLYAGRTDWKTVLSGNSKPGQKPIRNGITVIVIPFHLR